MQILCETALGYQLKEAIEVYETPYNEEYANFLPLTILSTYR